MIKVTKPFPKSSLYHLLTQIKHVASTASPQNKINYFELFGLKKDFNEAELKSSYLELVKKYHPDLSKEANCSDKFRQIQQGYNILSDSMKRNEHLETAKWSQKEEEKPFSESQGSKYMKDNFWKTYTRKEGVENDEMHFSYNLFKTHYEKIDEEKKKYTKYTGHDKEYYEKNDLQPDYYKQAAIVGTTIAIFFGAYYLVTF